MMNKELAKRIKELRIRKGFTQEELSETAGLSLRTVQRIENGETEPLADSIKRIANALDANPEELIDWSIKEDNFFLKALNLSALTYLLFPILGILVPYIMWSAKKDKIKGINEVGKDIVNFQIMWNLTLFMGFILMSFLMVYTTHLFPFVGFIILMYLLNFFLILFNTFLIHKEKPVRYYPKIRFFG